MNTANIPAVIQSLHGFVAGHGAMLLAGVTALLAGGAIAARLQRSPLHRQRLGEITAGCTLLWLVLACVPLPRWGLARPSAPARPFPATPLKLPAATTTDGIQVAGYEGEGDAELAALLSTVTRPAPQGPYDAAALRFRPETSPPSNRFNVPSLLAAAYLVGAFACSAWLLLGNVLLARIVRDARRPPDWLQELFLSLHRATSPRRPPRLLVSDRCARPVSCGVLRPTVLLPADCAAPGKVLQLRHVLLHELGHVRQRDALGNALLNLVMPLLYFHPIYWLVRSDVHLARELVADDWAAARTGKSSYVAELVALARSHLPSGACAGAKWAAVGLFLFGPRSATNFYRRMHMLMHRRDPLATRCSPAWRLASLAACAVVLAGAAGVVGVRPARAQESPSDETSRSTPEKLDGEAVEQRKLAAEREQLRASLDSKEAELARARSELEHLLYNAKVAEAQHNRRQLDVRSTQDQLDVLKKQLADEQSKAADMKNRADVGEKQLAQRLAELKQREVQINKATAELQARAADLAKMQAATKFDADALARDKKPNEKLLKDHSDAKAAKTWAKKFQDDSGATDSDPFQKDPGRRHEGGALRLDTGALDLVSLATSYADAVGDVRMAEVRVKVASQSDRITDRALEEAGLAKSQQKARLLRSIAEIALAGAEADLQRTEQLSQQKLASQADLAEARAKLQILKVILDAGSSSSSSSQSSQGQRQ
jgi:hypothetical protein